MNAEDPSNSARQVWQRIAAELPRERRRRIHRRVTAAGLCAGAVAVGLLAFMPFRGMQPQRGGPGSSHARLQPPELDAEAPASERELPMVFATGIPTDTLAVVVWTDGAPRLQEVQAEDWSDLDFQLSLEPVVRFDWPELWAAGNPGTPGPGGLDRF